MSTAGQTDGLTDGTLDAYTLHVKQVQQKWHYYPVEHYTGHDMKNAQIQMCNYLTGLCSSLIHSVYPMILLDSEGPDQTAQMHRLIWAFTVHICPKSCVHMMLPIYGVRPLSLESKPCEKGAWKIENSKRTDMVDIALDKRGNQINIFFILHKTYGCTLGKMSGHMWTAKAQISLPIQAV